MTEVRLTTDRWDFMTRQNSILVTLAAFTFIVCVPTYAMSAPPAAKAGGKGASSFNKFCKVWMGKLAARERNNLKGASARKNGGRFVVEYTSYAQSPQRCEAKPTGVASNPYVGKLVYTERAVRRTGATKSKARSGSVQVVSEVEVMEIFRYDGKRWVY